MALLFTVVVHATEPPPPSPPGGAAPAPEGAAPAPGGTTPAPSVKAAPPPAIDYSLPWGLRSAFAGTGARLDSSFALSHDLSNNPVFTEASVLGVSYRVMRGLAVGAKFAWVANQPASGPTQTTVSNVGIGAQMSLPFKQGFFLTPFVGMTLPIGMGGGNTPNISALAADYSGANARAVSDNTLFAIDELTVGGGLGAAWIAHKVTIQLEATIGELIRVRGDQFFPDAYRTPLFTGLHVGYTPIRALSIGAELRSMIWLSTPSIVVSDPSQRITLAVAGGVRGHFRLARRVSIHPGISYTRGLTGQLATNDYNILGLDIPVAF